MPRSALRILGLLPLFGATGLTAAFVTACGNADCGCANEASPLTVQAALDAGPISGVAATLIGQDGWSEPMMCVAEYWGVTDCSWSSWALPAGGYAASLEVTAPGYATTNVPATITVDSTSGGCSCHGSSLTPSAVTLQPALDGGM